MAGTIIRTPAISANDWSPWITQQGATDTGFMRVSLTNFSGTAASAIATGSVLECAGSIYTFSETAITLAIGTASSAVAVYYNVIPSAGGTTLTITMDSTAPTWVDAKQGFYASAASLSRIIGGCYIGTAATYYTKYLYTGENLIYCLQTGNTRPLLKKTLEIGEWNMDATASIGIDHTLGDFKKVRGVSATIKDDTNANYYDFATSNLHGEATNENQYILSSASGVTLLRQNGGIFDGLTFDGTVSTVANRGWVYIEYEA